MQSANALYKSRCNDSIEQPLVTTLLIDPMSFLSYFLASSRKAGSGWFTNFRPFWDAACRMWKTLVSRCVGDTNFIPTRTEDFFLLPGCYRVYSQFSDILSRTFTGVCKFPFGASQDMQSDVAFRQTSGLGFKIANLHRQMHRRRACLHEKLKTSILAKVYISKRMLRFCIFF